MALAAGAVLGGRYRLERKLGQGGMGEVWAAKNIAVGTDVAVKTMHAEATADAELVMRFRREAFLLARIKNDHVARVLDFVTDDAFGLVLVMDLIDGPSLAEVLKEKRLTVEEGIDLGADVLSGMLDLHKANVVHRDLKPGNIILEPRSGGRPKAVIVDFGLGRIMNFETNDDSGITRADIALGTMEYMAPEQILNSRSVTSGADVYALGAMLYRAVAGAHIFGDLTGLALAQFKLANDAPPLVTRRNDPTARGFESVIRRTIARRPQDRYASAEAMLGALVALGGQVNAPLLDEKTMTIQDSTRFRAALAAAEAGQMSSNSQPPSADSVPPASGRRPATHATTDPPLLTPAPPPPPMITPEPSPKRTPSIPLLVFMLILGGALGMALTLYRLGLGVRGAASLISPPPAALEPSR